MYERVSVSKVFAYALYVLSIHLLCNDYTTLDIIGGANF